MEEDEEEAEANVVEDVEEQVGVVDMLMTDSRHHRLIWLYSTMPSLI